MEVKPLEPNEGNMKILSSIVEQNTRILQQNELILNVLAKPMVMVTTSLEVDALANGK